MESNKEKQFLKIYDELADKVFRHCYFRLSDREKAKDAVQKVFCRFWEYLEKHDDQISNAKALVFRIANNLIIDHYRNKKDESLDALQADGFDVANDDYEAIMTMLSGRELTALLDCLKKSYRDVIVMRYIDDLPVQEIAGIISERENTVSVRIHRGLKELKKIIENEKHD